MKILSILNKNKITIIVLLALLLRLIGIDRGLWSDEQISLNTLNNNIFINPFYFGYTTNLPLYFYLLKIWTLGGIVQNIIYLRLLGVLINLVNIIIFYKFFNNSSNTRLGLLLCFFTAITPLQIHYAQEIRPYILTQLLISIHFIKTIDYIKSKNSIPLSLFLLTIVLLFTHYASFLYLISISLIAVFYKKKNLIKVKNIIYFSILVITTLILVFINIQNPKFIDSFLSTGINNYKWGFQSLTEMVIRVKEVVSFYYFFGFWYYLVSPLTQNIFKKLFIFIFILTILLILKKVISNKIKVPLEVLVSTYILVLVMIVGFILEKFGIYPFGGRHIMPFSIFLYMIISFGFDWFINLNHKVNKIIILFLLIFTFLVFIFHQSCVIKISKNQPNITQGKSYYYCFKSLLF